MQLLYHSVILHPDQKKGGKAMSKKINLTAFRSGTVELKSKLLHCRGGIKSISSKKGIVLITLSWYEEKTEHGSWNRKNRSFLELASGVWKEWSFDQVMRLNIKESENISGVILFKTAHDENGWLRPN
ncbi:MAG: hypothetical protein NUV47_03040 [Patescibacteria group bacterium]|nr:hypothetical protein [Patescibacteria group bacterium]